MAKALLYVDDSKVTMKVKNEEDVAIFQEEMEIFYLWAKENNMDFNSLKFVVLRYGRDQDLKDNTVYFSDNMAAPIDSLDAHKDLGVIMAPSGTFNAHIEAVIKKVRKRIGWLCRTDRLEKLQAYYTRLIPEIRNLSYPERQVFKPPIYTKTFR